MKVAIVHYWFVSMRGGEKVIESLCEMFPDADIYTHVVDRSAISERINSHTISTTFIQKLPFSKRFYKYYLPLMPMALEELDLTDYDLVISSEAGPAKGVIVRPDAIHICYCHSPMRYIWDLYGKYTSSLGRTKRLLIGPLLHYMRMFDTLSASRVDQFVANSNFVAQRIQRYYRRQSIVIPPPVETNIFQPSNTLDNFYLLAGQLVPYKHADLAIDAFNQLGLPLVVIGGGEQLKMAREMAKSNVTVLGFQPNSVLQSHLARCKALIFPGKEDFGILPVEAMASGKPVIAYGSGGVQDTVIDGTTGVFFHEQTPEAIMNAVKAFECSNKHFDAKRIAKHAQQFDKEHFIRRMKHLVDQMLSQRDATAQRVFRGNDGFSHHFSELTPLFGQGVGDRSLGQPPC